MDLRVLNYFLAIAREQSIVRAAESLHLSQPTLSVQIKALEEELGKPLLIRGTKGSRKVTLTEDGMLLKKRAEEILSLVEKTEKEISLSGQLLVGDIHIGAGETDAVRLLARAARSLRETCPDVRFHFISGNAEYVTGQLEKGLLDFGVVFGPVDHTVWHSLALPCQDTMGILMRQDSPLAQKAAVTPEDLRNSPLILSQQANRDGTMEAWFGCGLSELKIAATYNLLFNASLLVSEGVGYAVGLDKIINTSSGCLCFRPFTPELTAQAQLIWRKGRLLSRAAEHYLTVLQSSPDFSGMEQSSPDRRAHTLHART